MNETVTRVIALRFIPRMAYMDERRFLSEVCDLLKIAVKNHYNICKKCIFFVDFHAFPDDTHIDRDCTLLLEKLALPYDLVSCYRKVILSPWFRKAKGLKVMQEYVEPTMSPVGRSRIEIILDDETQAAFDAERQMIHDNCLTILKA